MGSFCTILFVYACHCCCSDLRLTAASHGPNVPLLTDDKHQPSEPQPFLFSCRCSVKVLGLQAYCCEWGSPPFSGHCFYGYRCWSTQPKPSITTSSFSFLLFPTRVRFPSQSSGWGTTSPHHQPSFPTVTIAQRPTVWFARPSLFLSSSSGRGLGFSELRRFGVSEKDRE